MAEVLVGKADLGVVEGSEVLAIRVAELEDIKILNINDLANAVKVVILPEV